MKILSSFGLVLAVFSTSFSFNAFAQDCIDFSGNYQLVSGTETTNSCPSMPDPNPETGMPAEPSTNCFSFASDNLTLAQSGCTVTMTTGQLFSSPMTLTPTGDGYAIEGQDNGFLRVYTVTLVPAAQDQNVLDMTYTQQTKFLGSLAYPYEYHAQFRKTN
jgi:hypothetical protein